MLLFYNGFCENKNEKVKENKQISIINQENYMLDVKQRNVAMRSIRERNSFLNGGSEIKYTRKYQ